MNERIFRRRAGAGWALLLLGLAVAVSCANKDDPPRTTPTGARASCAVDDDCTSTTFSGCCSCCPEALHAIPKRALEQQQAKCAVVDCAPCSKDIQCAPVPPDRTATTTVAVHCRAGQCVVADP